MRVPVDTLKPAYRVPTMDEIRALPWNGFTAVSTFSGCGGSSLGYRMAGFRMLWANEFIPAAQDTYRANAAPYTVLDQRDIRTVAGAEILAATGLSAGELDLFDGSPPCASFSTAGKREAGWGKAKKYSDTTQRTDDLFYEYARLVREVQPRVLVAENVSGLVKGTAKGYFIKILAELRACGYRVTAKLLDAQWLGVPQARQRLIFIGVRNDLKTDPAFPAPLPYRYSVREALPRADVTERPSPTIAVGGDQVNACHYRVITTAHYGEQEPRVYEGGEPSPTVTAPGIGGSHGNSEVALESPSVVSHDPETGKDLRIGRYAIGREYERLRQGESSDRYFQLTRADENRPSPTVTQRGGSIDAASVTHPVTARKFTLGELRAICGFPADFVLTGSYEQRWERLGRAVPPVMMAAVAAVARDRILTRPAGSE